MTQCQGRDDATEAQRARHAAGNRRLDFAAMDRLEGAAKDFRMLRTRRDPDRKRTSEKAGKAYETIGAEQPADRGDRSASAEIEKIDNE
jgi:hypothetical protein